MPPKRTVTTMNNAYVLWGSRRETTAVPESIIRRSAAGEKVVAEDGRRRERASRSSGSTRRTRESSMSGCRPRRHRPRRRALAPRPGCASRVALRIRRRAARPRRPQRRRRGVHHQGRRPRCDPPGCQGRRRSRECPARPVRRRRPARDSPHHLVPSAHLRRAPHADARDRRVDKPEMARVPASTRLRSATPWPVRSTSSAPHAARALGIASDGSPRAQ